MEVADHLHFPRTNVTIYARELVFTGHGRIDTTPLSLSRPPEVKIPGTTDPDELAKILLRKFDGKPTYEPVNGRKGEPGGKIIVHARVVSVG